MKYILRDEGIKIFENIRKARGKSDTKFDQFFIEVKNDFLIKLSAILEKHLPENTEIVIYNGSEIDAQKKILVAKLNYPIVTLDSYSQLKESFKLGISRCFDNLGKDFTKIVERPGYIAIERQVQELVKLHYKKIILDEDDIFSGATINTIASCLSKYGITIVNLIVGIQVGTPKDNVLARKTISIVKENPSDVLDLVDPRDFLFNSYEGGLVVNHIKPIRVPYVLPWVNPEYRASICNNKGKQFSIEVHALNKEISEEVSKIQ